MKYRSLVAWFNNEESVLETQSKHESIETLTGFAISSGKIMVLSKAYYISQREHPPCLYASLC